MGSERACEGDGEVARRFARDTISIRRRSMHVVERKEERGSVEPGGGGTGAIDRGGRDMVIHKIREAMMI
jgi:hypothetical protein